MDQTQNNLERIRALDAEEGEWRTINGAHVLIKNGRIAAGAGGALNGQRFQGHSVKKMAAGMTGRTTSHEIGKANQSLANENAKYKERGALLRKGQEEASKSFAEEKDALGKKQSWLKTRRDKARRRLKSWADIGNEVQTIAGTGYQGGPRKKYLEQDLKNAGFTFKYQPGEMPADLDEGEYYSPGMDIVATKKGRGNKKYSFTMVPGRGDRFSASSLHINAGYERDPVAGFSPSDVANSQYLTRLQGEMHAPLYEEGRKNIDKKHDALRGKLDERYAPRLKKAKEKADRATGALEAYNGAETEEHNRKISAGAARMATLGNAQSKAAAYLVAHPELKRGGRQTPTTSRPASTQVSGRRLGRVPAGYTGKNYDKETKRLGHNAKVYVRTAGNAMKRKAATLNPQIVAAKTAGESSRAQAMENQLHDYNTKMTRNIQNRNTEAAGAKNRLSNMKRMAKALKQSHPEVFARALKLKGKLSRQ